MHIHTYVYIYVIYMTYKHIMYIYIFQNKSSDRHVFHPSSKGRGTIVSGQKFSPGALRGGFLSVESWWIRISILTQKNTLPKTNIALQKW